MENKKNIDLIKLNYDIPVIECFSKLVPHPKFTGCTFDNYKEDMNYPSQLYLKNKLKEIPVNNSKKKPFSIKKIFSGKKEVTENIYIDGTYGIGKTHLLSALFHFFDDSKAFLSFLELTYFINYYGLDKTIEEFKKVKLLLLDEFDLDDPATTRMMARFISEVNKYTTIVTTSNRLPKELGGTNFDTGAFARELGIIADSFTTIVVEGESFRIKLGKWQASYSDNNFNDVYNNFQTGSITDEVGSIISKIDYTISKIDYNSLNKILQSNHPFKFFVIPNNVSVIFIENFDGFTKLNDALRFSVFVDHCYYYDTKLFFNKEMDRQTLFPKEIMETTFERQFLRCLSRLDEIAIFFKG